MNSTQSTTEPTTTTAPGPGGRVPAPTVWPTLTARDGHALIRFLVDVVGFREVAVHTAGDRVAHAELAWPEGGGLMISAENEEWPVRPGTFGASVVTDHVDEVYDRVRRAGARIVAGPRHEDYGNYGFVMRDSEGNHWAFGTYRGQPVPD